MLGTFVKVISPDKNAPKIVFPEMQRVENLLSKYKESSEVAQLNKAGELKIGPDTLYVLEKAKEFSEITNGAFDISVGPLVDLWGFTNKQYRLPEKQEIEKALALVGSDKIILNISDNVVKFKLSGMKIDLGAIGKGYALDCAVKKLKEHGIKSCLINAGGQIYCLGDKFGKPWRVALRSPRGKDFKDYLELKDCSVSTSGDYEQYFLIENKRFSHIFNPKDGYPANSGILSVTVIAPSGLIADCLSTSIFVLGKDKGLELAKKFPNVKVKIIQEKDVSDHS
jgi:thiamine biosynthesis lipoprotein